MTFPPVATDTAPEPERSFLLQERSFLEFAEHALEQLKQSHVPLALELIPFLPILHTSITLAEQGKIEQDQVQRQIEHIQGILAKVGDDA